MYPVFDKHFNVVSDTQKMRQHLDIAGGLRAINLLKQILTVFQGKCLKSTMQV